MQLCWPNIHLWKQQQKFAINFWHLTKTFSHPPSLKTWWHMSEPPEISCASEKYFNKKTIKLSLLMNMVFHSDHPVPEWDTEWACMVLTGTAHVIFKMTCLKNGMQDWVIVIFSQLLDTISSHFHSDTYQNISSARDKILRITNHMPQGLVCLAATIGTSPLTSYYNNKSN